MTTFRRPLAVGLVLALPLGAAGSAGYGVLVYYCWMPLLVVLLLLAMTVRRQPSAIAYLCTLVLLVILAAAGTFAGHWARRLQCRARCKACQPLLSLVEKHRGEHGQYPTSLAEVEGFAFAQRDSGLNVAQGKLSRGGIDLDGVNSHDGLIYLDTNFVSCVVPVTKQIPMSFTRLYVYTWNTDTRSWQYDKLVWHLGLLSQ